MPINRLARVPSQSSVEYPPVRENSVPFVYDEAYAEIAFTDASGATRHIPWLQDGIHTENLLRYEYGTITNAEIKALRATPKTLVGAVAAGKMIELVALLLLLDYGSNVLTESADNLEVYYSGGTVSALGATIEATGFIDAAADTALLLKPVTLAYAAGSAVDGKGLILKNTGDGEYAGNAGADTVIRYKVVYRVHPTGW